MIKLWFILILLLPQQLLGNLTIPFTDLSLKINVSERIEFINKNSLSGIRLHIGGIKEANKVGSGNVNETIESFQKQVKQELELNLKNNNQGISHIHFFKTDFKGYYITCQPITNNFDCRKKISQILNPLTTSTLVVKNPSEKKAALHITQAIADNYKEGYIKARFIANFDDFKPDQDLNQFITSKTQEIIKLYQEKKINPEKLKEAISIYRREGLDKVTELDYQKAILLLDALEVPYATSSNLEQSLHQIIKHSRGPIELKNGITISQAMSGDDLYILIKDANGMNVDLIGVDARGLGVTNMMTRIETLIGSSKAISKADDIIDLSLTAIKRADTIMFESMKTYIDQLEKKLNQELPSTDHITSPQLHDRLLEILKKADMEYNHMASSAPNLMLMRAARLNPENIDSITDVRDSMNLMSKLHNQAKIYEETGVMRVITVDHLKKSEYLAVDKAYRLMIPSCLLEILN